MTGLNAFRKILAILAVSVTFSIGATFLPDNAHQRYSQLEGTIYDTVRWTYERIHDDPRPIDVVIVGSSRTRLGLRSSLIEERLAQAGKPAQVVNTSFIGSGRNAEWVYVHEMFKTKRPKVIVLAIDSQPHPWGHDAFRYIAPAADVWRQSGYGLYNSPKDLMYLPYRQIRLFAAQFAPDAFGLPKRFDPKLYAATRSDFTVSWLMPQNRWFEMDKPVPREDLIEQARKNRNHSDRHSKLPAPLRKFTDADDHIYTEMIAREAARHGAKLLFVYIPGFAESPTIKERAFYEKLGTIQENNDLQGQDPLYQGWAHVNAAGAEIVSSRVAAKLAQMLP